MFNYIFHLVKIWERVELRETEKTIFTPNSKLNNAFKFVWYEMTERFMQNNLLLEPF